MSKELLDNVYTIKNAIAYLKGNSYIKEDSYSMEALYHIEKALTPPTAEEVCDKKLELYKRLFNVCKEYKHTSIGLSDDSEFLNVMFELEEELK